MFTRSHCKINWTKLFIFQGKSTCRIDVDVDRMVNLEGKEVMNLRSMESSPYLKHPIWFLSTMKDTKCYVCPNCAPWFENEISKTSQNNDKSNSRSAIPIGITIPHKHVRHKQTALNSYRMSSEIPPIIFSTRNEGMCGISLGISYMLRYLYLVHFYLIILLPIVSERVLL